MRLCHAMPFGVCGRLLYQTSGLAQGEEHAPGWHVAWFLADAVPAEPA